MRPLHPRHDSNEIPIEGTLISSTDATPFEEGSTAQKTTGFPPPSQENPQSKFQYQFSTNPKLITFRGCKPLLGCLLFFFILMVCFASGFLWMVQSIYHFLKSFF